MSLKNRIESDFIGALKNKEGLRVSCLRMIKAAIINKEFEKTSKELDDAGVVSVLSGLVKRAQESIEQFEKGGRADLAQKEKDELSIIRAYMPQALSETELAKLVDAAIAEAGALSPKDMGKVMKLLAPSVAGRADGRVVSALVQERLKAK